MEVAVKNLQRKIPLNLAQASKIAKTILLHEGVKKANLSIAFVSSQKIRALNKKFLKREYVTDVLAFDLKGNGVPSKKRRKVSPVLGDIVISTDAAIQNANDYKSPLAREVVLYIIHGILHLLGYDDHSPRETKRMRKKEQELLGFLGKRINKVIPAKAGIK